jgi:hypothetical protein
MQPNIDPIVASVREKLLNRSSKGIEKYGTTLDRNDLSLVEWINHLQEELMDAANYAERILQEKPTSQRLFYFNKDIAPTFLVMADSIETALEAIKQQCITADIENFNNGPFKDCVAKPREDGIGMHIISADGLTEHIFSNDEDRCRKYGKFTQDYMLYEANPNYCVIMRSGQPIYHSVAK